MADRSRRISRGALNTVEDVPYSAEDGSGAGKDDKAMHLVEHEDILSTSHHGQACGHDDSQSGNLFSAILNRWLMSNAFYSSSVNSLRFKQ